MSRAIITQEKELAFILSSYYSDYELSTLVHSLAKYTSSFQYFVLGNHTKVKTVEEFAHLGGYTVTTFRRIFNSVFHEPVYEWMMKQRKEGIIYELRYTKATILRFVTNTDLNLYLISQISVRKTLELLLAAYV